MKIPNSKFQILNSNSGQAALTAVIFFVFISLALAAAFAGLALSEFSNAKKLKDSKQAHTYAEGVAEDAAYRLISGKNLPASIFYSEGGLSATTTVTEIDGNTRDILIDGAKLNIKRKSGILVEKAQTVSFLFAGLVDEGGISMQNTSKIIGDVHTNGSITGNNSPVIEGDASAVGAISDPPEVTGTRTEGAPAEEMPISDEILDEWQDEAESGGTIICSDGDKHEIKEDAAIGPAKIPCDLVVSGSPTVTITGKIWVEGDLDIKNTAIVRLDSSYGDGSEAIIAHDPGDSEESGQITVQNSAQILGSGSEDSYILMISRNDSAETGGDKEAINITNSSTASIYYAPHGKVTVQNSSSEVHLRTVTAWRLELKNKSTVEYEDGLIELKIPSQQWKITSWKEKP